MSALLKLSNDGLRTVISKTAICISLCWFHPGLLWRLKITDDGLELYNILVTIINRDFIFPFFIFSNFLISLLRKVAQLVQERRFRPQRRKRGMVIEYVSLYATHAGTILMICPLEISLIRDTLETHREETVSGKKKCPINILCWLLQIRMW